MQSGETQSHDHVRHIPPGPHRVLDGPLDGRLCRCQFRARQSWLSCLKIMFKTSAPRVPRRGLQRFIIQARLFIERQALSPHDCGNHVRGVWRDPDVGTLTWAWGRDRRACDDPEVVRTVPLRLDAPASASLLGLRPTARAVRRSALAYSRRRRSMLSPSERVVRR